MTSSHILQGTTVMGSRGQIVIPRSIRSALKLKAGTEMLVIAKDGKVVAIPADHLETMYQHILDSIDALRGKKGRKKPSA